VAVVPSMDVSREGVLLALESEVPDAAPAKTLAVTFGPVCAPLAVRRKSYRMSRNAAAQRAVFGIAERSPSTSNAGDRRNNDAGGERIKTEVAQELGNNAGPLGPACACLNKAADYAFAVSASQILMWRVSGIKNSPSTKHTVGTAIG
jgi:hypothetical protein